MLEDGAPLPAVGSPGGASIITTVLQTLLDRLDFDQDLAAAIAAPRRSPRNTAVEAEPAFLQRSGPALEALGHRITANAEIGAATGIEFLPGGLQLAAASRSAAVAAAPAWCARCASGSAAPWRRG